MNGRINIRMNESDSVMNEPMNEWKWFSDEWIKEWMKENKWKSEWKTA